MRPSPSRPAGTRESRAGHLIGVGLSREERQVVVDVIARMGIRDAGLEALREQLQGEAEPTCVVFALPSQVEVLRRFMAVAGEDGGRACQGARLLAGKLGTLARRFG